MPTFLNPKAWLSQGTGGSLIAYAGGDGSRAFIRGGGLELPGVAGNYASAPDSSALSITGDIDIKVKVKMTDWTPAAVQTLVAKAQTTSLRSYYLQVNTDGTLVLTTSTNGSATVTGTSTAATGVSDGATKWVRATLDVADSTNRVYKFYTSDDGSSWTQLGTTVTTAGTTSIHDNASVLEIGSITLGTANTLAGTVYRTIIQSAYDTANNTSNLAFDANFETRADYTRTFTEGSSNAAVVTVNQSSTTNDPLLLESETTGYVYCPNVLGNYVSIPDSVPLSITGDIDIKARIKLDDWTPASAGNLAMKYSTTGNQRGWVLFLLTSGRMRLDVSPDGINTTTGASSDVLPIVDGQTKWVRVTLDVDDGAGNRVYKYYISDDGVSWTGAGSTTSAGTTSIFDNTAQLSFPLDNGSPLPGNYYRLIIQSAFDTANNTDNLVCDINCDAITSHGQTTFAEQSSNAATVTIRRPTTGRKTVAMPSISKGGNSLWLAGTDDFLAIADDAILDIGASDSATVLIVYRQWNNFGTNDALIAKKADTTNTTQGYYLGSGASTAAQLQAQIGDGTAGVTATETTSRTAGLLTTAAFVRNVTTDTLTTYRRDFAGTAVNDTTTTTLANSEAFRIGRLSGAGTEYTDMEIYAVLLWKRALSTGEIAALLNYYTKRIP